MFPFFPQSVAVYSQSYQKSRARVTVWPIATDPSLSLSHHLRVPCLSALYPTLGDRSTMS